VARLGDHFILKRMPYTGSHHAPDCPSYEPPADLSGLGQVLGSAITEDPESGVTSLKLGFSMSKTGGRSVDPGSENGPGSVTSGALVNGRQIPLTLEMRVDDADGPRKGFALELTPVWNEKTPILAYVNGVDPIDKITVRIGIVLFSQEVAADRYRVHFELNRFVPFTGD